MPSGLRLYVDDSGTRHPDHSPNSGSMWFGLGGVLLRDEDEPAVRASHADFLTRWPQIKGAPLHSAEIRNEQHSFAWLRTDPNLRVRFLEDIWTFLTEAPLLGIACVIDRAGYAARYGGKYDSSSRWNLCKTAFGILVERAAKFAIREHRSLSIFVERGDKSVDAWVKNYYRELRTQGMPFDRERMAKYAPLEAETFQRALGGLELKAKTSPMLQIADMYLWPICKSAYDPTQRSFVRMHDCGRLINCKLAIEDHSTLGIKYSCFDFALTG